ncbi:LLM class flavin-dependent oxidoreductase [Natrialba sp. INN-245]|uniref:LLM class flavin-dependent oxidoreductase n=1 Tax=Natrialba sp. INN-245 TaxID=2690967 RepID=UPI0013102187|nr:LLM class flavin-dependent oxidoreductase [Natrialba sp. INN-245]MWV38450.1 LLM class flavin-dependent oxidoreductase [Natrialba sp. INN-245]
MVEFGININNREPLLVESYTVERMLDLGEAAGENGFDSVWVGDSLLDRPRLEPISLLGNLAARTDDVKLGTGCMITPLRHPVQFLQAWNSLEMISDGRMELGACMGPPTPGCKEQYEVLDLDYRKRAKMLEEQLEIFKQFWREGELNYDGDIYQFDDVDFRRGPEIRDLAPVQEEPPILVVSNPAHHDSGSDDVINRAAKRIVELGDGWMAAGLSDAPEEYARQWQSIVDYAEANGHDPDDVHTTFQVTMTIDDDTDAADEKMDEYIQTYYPQLYKGKDPAEWGPSGDANDLIEWIEEFHESGCEEFIIRFGGEDQFEQMEKFADEVLPAF